MEHDQCEGEWNENCRDDAVIIMPNSDVNVDVDANVNDSGLGDIKSGLVDMVEGGVEDAVEDDSSTDDEVYYSDHSYAEQDDDELYETYIDEHGDFVKHQFKHFRPNTDMEDPQFKIGMLFSTPEVFKAAVKQHAIKQQRPLKLVKNDKRRLRAKCMGVMGDNKPCLWEVYAAKVMAESTYQMATYRDTHTTIINAFVIGHFKFSSLKMERFHTFKSDGKSNPTSGGILKNG
ncbi:hypothetical protein Vadar_011643 [Vaccinium darrowii]|uniref:Uncharacterized protein n=1 Tax=Vaccinium darrowii TaxID=229202 RepID=A0ACB7XRB7_9ERIC|nr:hypothetical protein Vadar_011643 [Vaccinium darrowii]